jgi:hypothetical protein
MALVVARKWFMYKYDPIIEELVKNTRSETQTSNVESVIIDLLRTDDFAGAIELAKKIHPSQEFASAFANGILFYEEDNINRDNAFIEIKKITGENIYPNEADIILRKYTGPDGKYYPYYRNVKMEILSAASRDALIDFFGSVLEDKSLGVVDYAKKYWQYLEEKIRCTNA